MVPDNLITSVYAHPEAVKKDISKAVERYRALAWKFDRFVFNDGTCKNLLNLEGTIPVHFKGNYYNIPICIWLIDTHPNNAPICYVKPTPDMQIRPSSYVDQNGKIYLPYLHDWNPKSSDLLGLIQVMIVAFGDIPPLFTVVKKRENPVPAPTPYPTMPQVYMPMPGATQNYPPYPISGAPISQPMVSGSYPLSNPTPYPTSNMPSYPPYPPTLASSSASASNSGTITDEHIKASLLTAVQDKVRVKMNDQVAQIRAELEILQQTSYELNQGKTKLLDIISKMEKEKNDLDRVYTLLKERDAELEKAKIDLEEKKEVDVDEAVITTAPLYKQILNAYAEEAAMEDAIYYMGEALRRSVIDLDVFLKQVRTLSRKQFMLRALMQKCRHKAGLAY